MINEDFLGIEESIDSLRILSKKNKDTLIHFASRSMLAQVYYRKHKFDKAESILFENRSRLKDIKSSKLKDSLILSDYGTSAEFYYAKQDYPSAFENYIDALKISKKMNDSIAIKRVYNGLGNVYMRQGLYNEAINSYEQILKYDVSKSSKSMAYNNIGLIYYYKQDFKNAEKFILESIEYLNSKNKQDIFNSYNNLAAISSYANKTDKAHIYFMKSYEIAKQIKSKQNIGTALLNLSSFYIHEGKVEKAEEFMDRCDSVINGISSITYKQNSYYHFYENYKELKNYKKALFYSERYVKFKDSIFSLENKKNIEELRLQYETELNEDKITNQQYLIETQNKQNNWLLAGLLCLFGLLSLSIFLYKQRIMAQKKSLKNQEELSTQRVTNLIETQKVKSYESHLKGQNIERERIAKDLHDSVSGNLAAIKMKLTDITINQSKEIEAIIASIDTTYNEVRTISHNLLPQNDIKQNFIDTLYQLIALYNSKTITFKIDVFPEKDLNELTQTIQIEVYRVLQELITNIVKHAKASNGIINITLHDDYLNLIVEDNGIGYDVITKKQGIGLQNITSRIKSMSGTLDVDSVIEKGTTVNISIPI
jgi:signal transduction histidine kinase